MSSTLHAEAFLLCLFTFPLNPFQLTLESVTTGKWVVGYNSYSTGWHPEELSIKRFPLLFQFCADKPVLAWTIISEQRRDGV